MLRSDARERGPTVSSRPPRPTHTKGWFVVLNPVRVDALVDLAYGTLIALSIALIATIDTSVGIAFGVGVFASYVVHVVWKMARFDPDWMTKVVEESMDEAIEKRVGETVERSVGDRLGEVEARVEAVDDRVDRRPREEEVERLIGESVGSERGERTDDGDGDDGGD